MRPIIDGHLDIAWNALSYDRDQLLELDRMREIEAGMSGSSRGKCTVSLPEMRRANVRVCLGTLLCRSFPDELPDLNANLGEIGERNHGPVILREDLDFANQTIACAAAQGQLAYYRLLEQQGHVRLIGSGDELDRLWADPDAPLGLILSMEGCDPIIEPSQARWWYEQGLRTACLAHYGPSAYAMGTGGDGPLTAKGRELLDEFGRLGLILDLVHTADTALEEALDLFDGAVFVSHGNCRALVEHDRQLSDRQIAAVVDRGGVIGVVMDEWMLVPGYVRGDSHRPRASFESVVAHVDHICSIAGDTDHIAIGSDLDGGFGTEQTPLGLETIADLHRIAEALIQHGLSDSQVNQIFSGNWLRFFRESLPDGHRRSDG
ncbi:MAG: membrane dipeptidase [Bryobacterales bacterium]|nr:membrane dipeptidase [Bryobacterales bacterium]